MNKAFNMWQKFIQHIMHPNRILHYPINNPRYYSSYLQSIIVRAKNTPILKIIKEDKNQIVTIEYKRGKLLLSLINQTKEEEFESVILIKRNNSFLLAKKLYIKSTPLPIINNNKRWSNI